MVQFEFASYLRRVFCKTRLIFLRINGPNIQIKRNIGLEAICSDEPRCFIAVFLVLVIVS